MKRLLYITASTKYRRGICRHVLQSSQGLLVRSLLCRTGILLVLLGAWFSARTQQNYYDHWAFGSGVHVDFSSGTPVVTCNVSINSQEGAAVWSHPVTGQFLAYTDGATVYNGTTNAVLTNGTGLIANSSSIESALILPKPGGTLDEFYVFHNNITNAYWTTADLSIGTNGTVLSKNNFLQATGTERCGTLPHGSICPAYWVVISKSVNDSVAAYLVDTNGISSTPVVTPTGITGGAARGNIVFSEDGTKIGMSVENKGMYVANFDDNTGMTSNWVKIGSTTNGFGSAFSPDGTKVYYTSAFGQDLYQYNFLNNTETYIGGNSLSYLALAPDGKIYVSRYGQQSLAVINAPNAAGTACNFVMAGLNIPTGCQCRWGLPNPFKVDIGAHPPYPDTITLCPGQDTLYTSAVVGTEYLWNTGDTSASLLLDAPGLYYATVGSGDCASSDSVYLQYVDQVSAWADPVCEDDTTRFEYQTLMPLANIASWSWDFGDGTSAGTDPNPWHVYADGDTFSVSLSITTTMGCVLEADTFVVVHPNPDPSFDFENPCDGEQVAFTNTSSATGAAITGYFWDIQNNGSVEYSSQNAVHTFSTYGAYAVELKAVDAIGCRDSLVRIVHVYPMPTAHFVTQDECLHEAHTFNDSSTVDVGSIASAIWSFGDGQSTTGSSVQHIYNQPGTYQVQQRVVTDSGCQDSVVIPTTVYHLPSPSFTVLPVCEQSVAVFQRTSTSVDGVLVSTFWDFGDGDTSHLTHPSHSFSTPGLYSVAMTAVTSLGCRDTIWNDLRVYPLPNAAFAWENNVCEGQPLHFNDQSTVDQVTPGGDWIAAWLWTKDGAFFSSDTNPVLHSASPQTANMKLKVTSNYGCQSETEQSVHVYPNPDAGLHIATGCHGMPTVFSDSSHVDFGIIDFWRWDFGVDERGIPLTEPDSSLSRDDQWVYDQPGEYTVRLYVESNRGCHDSIEQRIMVPETPSAAFTISPTEGCAPLTFTAANHSHSNEASLRYKWYLDSIFVSTSTSLSWVLYNTNLVPEVHPISLEVIADNGCTATMHQPEAVVVLPQPKAGFETEKADYEMFHPEVNLFNRSEQGVRWHWTFGDGGTSSQFAPTHLYTNHGMYELRLVAWNAYNCTDTAVQFLTIDPITTLYVPSAFTPNGDGDNDEWFVAGFNEGKDFYIEVWDRWGHLVFKSTDMQFTWDGFTSEGIPAMVGVYTYRIVFLTSDDHPQQLTGKFSLIR